MTKTKKKYKNNIGGKVLASGGFGCVFFPSLKCKTTNKSEKNLISKLMTNKHAIQEFKQINSLKKKLQKIPNYTDYFLIYDLIICYPKKLQSKDLLNYTKKCTALQKKDITKSNINSKLDEIMAINMPNGGIPIDDYILNNNSFEKLYYLHISLTQLLEKGIIPMNKMNIYHNDIKDSNILVDISNNELKTRLIDWGLSTKYIPFKNKLIPSILKNRPFQFNVPFSNIIFSDFFIENYTEFLEINNNNLNVDNLQLFLNKYISFWNKKRGFGHWEYINKIFYLLYQNNITPIQDYELITKETILNYITNILIKYTKIQKNGYYNFNLNEYLDNIFIKNIDLWGFVNSYYPFLEMFSNKYSILNIKEKKIFDNLQNMFIDCLYNSAEKQIDILKLLKNLKEIKQLFEEIIG
jgi:hypothetical protein